MESLFTFIVEGNQGILILVVGVIGIFGNITAVFVFGKPQQYQKNFHVFMCFLAIFDLLYIIVAILVFVLPAFCSSYKTNGYHHHIAPLAIPMGQVSMTGSIYFTMGITIERYLTVCHPFYTISREWPTKTIVSGISLFAIIYNIPKFMEIRTEYEECTLTRLYQQDEGEHWVSNVTANCSGYIHTINPSKVKDYFPIQNETEEAAGIGVESPSPLQNETTTFINFCIQARKLRLNSYYVQIYAVYMNFFINGLGPFTLLIVLNILIIKELKKIGLDLAPAASNSSVTHNSVDHYKEEQPNSQDQGKTREVEMAQISLMIVFIFIFCHSIKWIPNTYEILVLLTGKKRSGNGGNKTENSPQQPICPPPPMASDDEPEEYWPGWVEHVTHISHFLLAFNCSVNFFIYFFKRRASLKQGSTCRDTVALQTLQTRCVE